MESANVVTNRNRLLKLQFAGGIGFLFVMLLMHDPLMAGIGFLMVGGPALHWTVASPRSWKLGRYRTPVLATIYFAMWGGLLVALVWAIQRATVVFGA
jgi:hypothetical protein